MPLVSSFEIIAWEAGYAEGYEIGLRAAIRTVVAVRFGVPAPAIVAGLDQARWPELEAVLELLRTVKDREEFLALLPMTHRDANGPLP